MFDTEILLQQHAQHPQHAPQQQPQHVTLYLQHRRALVEWLLEVASVNPLGLAAPSSLAHKAVALLDEVISVPRLTLLCAVDPVRLPLMAVACLSIACKKQNSTHNYNTHNLRNSSTEEREVGVVVQDRQQEGGGQIFSLTLLNKFCHDRYSEEIIAKMEALLTRIIELAQQQKNVHNKESQNEEEGFTSFDWLAHFLEVLEGKELPQEDATENRNLHFVLSEYANLFLDLFLHEDSTYLGTYSGRLIAAASLGAARQQLGQAPVWLPCLEDLTGCSLPDVVPCLNEMWQRAQEEFDIER